MQKAFAQMKSVLMIADAFMSYPNHNKPFDIETDLSDYQMGAVIKQDGCPVAWWLLKLTGTQKNRNNWKITFIHNYGSKRIITMLLGAKLTIFTDLKN